jgi:DNA polymerase IIIc chi subunit
VDADPECRRLGRERFKTYRDHKLALETHQLSDAADI